MAIERKFVSDGVTKARIEQFLNRELKRAGYGGMDIVRTPLGTQITIFAEKPGIVIGKGGKLVRQLTQDLATNFDIDSPQVEVQQVPNPNTNAQIMAERLATALERGWYFRKAGSSTLRRVMESGALGCEIILSGKLTGARSRVQKFVDGHIKHAGEPSETIVEKGFAVAVKKLGTIGVQVMIIPGDAKLPDEFEILEPKPLAEVVEIVEPEVIEDIGEDVDAELEEFVEEVPEAAEFVEEEQ
ncbi:30S ribosomal protein S3 [Methanofollis formosanus]|uniref:Small ribosomal subunit protein uS3 n=1 Tax=Methanofollis formosanus TaxID=299308 RepID=A0A8G1A292_9EURY|nr:30S ribosomal protein S3 [Methanofollis formosanus]QYZ79098.1 30S ribosomal protein S3 [Methanofollis formosanus]